MLDLPIVGKERCFGVSLLGGRVVRIVEEVQIVLERFLHHFNLSISVHVPITAQVFNRVSLELVG